MTIQTTVRLADLDQHLPRLIEIAELRHVPLDHVVDHLRACPQAEVDAILADPSLLPMPIDTTASDLIERHRFITAQIDTANAQVDALMALMPAPDVILNRRGDVVTYARSEAQVNAHFDRFPDWVFQDRETWREAKLEEFRAWDARRAEADRVMGVTDADDRLQKLWEERDAAFVDLCAYRPQSLAEVVEIAAYVVADEHQRDPKADCERFMTCDLMDAWAKLSAVA